MRTDRGYRYSLLINKNTDEGIRVGEFLEGIGHKKSTVLVQAMVEFLNRNPELEKQDGSVKLQVKQHLTRSDIESIVRECLQKSGASVGVAGATAEDTASHDDLPYDDTYVDMMVDNLSEHFDI